MNVISPLVNRASIRFEKRFATALSPVNKRVTFSYDDTIVLKYLYWLERNKLNAIFNWLAREKKTRGSRMFLSHLHFKNIFARKQAII